jgi:hypothetical protein
LDRFLISDTLLNQALHYRQWIGSGGESNHSPIFLDIEGGLKNPLSPFKYNPTWEKEESISDVGKGTLGAFRSYGGVALGVHFVANLKRLKITSVRWAAEKKRKG